MNKEINKTVLLHEKPNCNDNIKAIRGHVVAYVHGTNIPLFEEWNKVILAGSACTAMKLFKGLTPGETIARTKTYNEYLTLDETKAMPDDDIKNNTFICLFAIGDDGCAPGSIEGSMVNEVDYTKWIAEPIPFKYPYSGNDTVDRAKYFGRRVNANGTNNTAYYFKAFDSISYRQQYVNGDKIEDNVYASDNTSEAETVVDIKMSITNTDCREYFSSFNDGLASAAISSISLLTAVEDVRTLSDGSEVTYYQNIRPFTKLNFPREGLSDTSKGIDIIYSLYF